MSELKKLSSEKQELVNEILEMIKNDSLSWKKVWKSLEAPSNPVTDKKYRGTNNVRLLVSSFSCQSVGNSRQVSPFLLFSLSSLSVLPD